MCKVRFTEWSDVLGTYWQQQRTATNWVAKLEALSALKVMESGEKYDFDISSIGPSDKY